MKRFFRLGAVVSVISAAALLSGCAETQFLASSAKHMGNTPAYSGHYKIGNPYQIQGVWYYPAEDYDYVETGIASWYGPKFHGKPTANGELFDMNKVSAAHRTLPLPSVVRVTNLDNGRSLVVRVNDRGPFAHGRILDMSKRGAQLLGFEKQGTARVKVEIMQDQSLAMKNSMVNQVAAADSPIKSDGMPKPQVSTASLSEPVAGEQVQVAPPVAQRTFQERPMANVQPSPVQDSVQYAAVAPTQMFVQAGAFSRYDNANRVKASLSQAGNVEISQVLVGGQDFYRVRVGPINAVGEADRVLERVIQAGYPGAKIVIEKN